MTDLKLLTRDQFREAVWVRDQDLCVWCKAIAQDAHHILERRLWPDGGYYLGNGASVCGPCHILCERTTISVEELRERIGSRKIIPPHLYDDQEYDKWGNPVLTNGNRLKGELFFDESVQKVLKEGGVLDLFVDQVKYPRTHHVPWSEGMHDDDRQHKNMTAFEGQEIVVTEKMDGENTSMYSDYIHARSIDGRSHPSRDWVKQFWSTIAHDIPKGWRVCGENLYAKHSIGYDNLSSYFMGFSIWNEGNQCLSWDETLYWFELLGISPVPILYRGPFDEKEIRLLYDPSTWSLTEGYVVRLARSFDYSEFRHVVGKFVRKGHVQTTKHWMHGQRIEPNGLIQS